MTAVMRRAHHNKVADVAIVAVVGRRISVFIINARARVGVVNARFGVARSAGDSNHSANFTAGINSRECIGQYAWPYPAIVVNGGGYAQQRVCIWVDINIKIYT